MRKGDAARVGSKAANLGELLGQGFPVPPGFVVQAISYRATHGLGKASVAMAVVVQEMDVAEATRRRRLTRGP